MKKTYSLTVAGKTTRFIHRDGEEFDEALSRGAAKLGYRGGAWAAANFHMNHQVIVTSKPARGESARASFTGVCTEE